MKKKTISSYPVDDSELDDNERLERIQKRHADEKERVNKMTVEEYVATFSDVMGQDIVYKQMPLDEYLATLPKPLRPLFRWYDEAGYDADVDDLRAEYPNLTTLDAYLRATGWENWQPAE